MLRTARPAPERPGYTLVELLVVIAIIGILAGLILSAVVKVKDRGQDLRARADLSQLDSAAGEFKTKFPGTKLVPAFGRGPNGSFRLRKRYVPANAVAGFPNDVDIQSPEAQFFKQMYPNMILDVSTRTAPNPGSVAADGQFGTGLPDLDLNPNQAMVFFLGGYFLQVDISSNGGNVGNNRRQMWFQGNLTDPLMPFRHDTNSYPQVPTGLKPPSFDFPAARVDILPSTLDAAAGTNPGPKLLKQTASPAVTADAVNAAPCFLDPWGTPYLYMNANGNRGYMQTATTPGVPTGAGTAAPTAGGLPVTNPTQTNPPSAFTGFMYWRDASRPDPSPDPLKEYVSVNVVDPLTTLNPFKSSANRFINDQTQQVVSAGKDRVFGPGGDYRSGANLVYYQRSGGEVASKNIKKTGTGADDLANFTSNPLGAGD